MISTIAPDTPESDLAAPPDVLLAALDEFTNAVYWLQQRATITAETALIEAIDDWLQGEPVINLRTAMHVLADTEHTATALAEAVNAWSSAQAAEHHRSLPFQAPRH
jgi:hypothetical protein